MISSATPDCAKSVKYALIKKISTVKRFAWVNGSSHNGQDGISTICPFFVFLAYTYKGENGEKSRENKGKTKENCIGILDLYTKIPIKF